MSGEAVTNKFMLGTATVMLGPQSKLRDLEPANHSIGLVKSVSFSAEPSYVELTQGVKNSLVHSVMNANVVKTGFEVYEYTAANLSYALGLDGSTITTMTDETTLLSEATAAQADLAVQVGDGALFSVDDWIMVQDGIGDHVLIRKVTAVVTDTLTCDVIFPTTLPIGTNIRKVNMIGVGSKEDQPFLSCKIVGTLADKTEMTFLIPKVRVTNGFNVAFQTDNYANMPFELAVYDLVSTDPNYADFKDVGNAMLFTQ